MSRSLDVPTAATEPGEEPAEETPVIDSEALGPSVDHGGAEPVAAAGSDWSDRFFAMRQWFGEGWLHNLIFATLALILAVVVYKAIRKLIHRFTSHRAELQQTEPMLVLVFRWIYIPIALLFVLQQVGVSPGSLWTVVSAGLAMIAIGFVAVWSVLSNVSSAFMIIFTRMFRIGDDVELLEPTAETGARGIVSDSNLIFTTLKQKSAKGGEVELHIPNNVFFQKAVRVRTGEARDPDAGLVDEPDEDAKDPQAEAGKTGADLPGEAAAVVLAEAEGRSRQAGGVADDDGGNGGDSGGGGVGGRR